MELSKPRLKTWAKNMLPCLLGAAGGYAYYYFIGCTTGGCPITSDPWISTAYGAGMGFLLVPPKFSRKQNSNEGTK